MKLLNWAKEKIKQISDWHGRKQFGDIKRFNQVAPLFNLRIEKTEKNPVACTSGVDGHL